MTAMTALNNYRRQPVVIQLWDLSPAIGRVLASNGFNQRQRSWRFQGENFGG